MTFTPLEKSGLVELDEMVCFLYLFPSPVPCVAVNLTHVFLFLFQAKFGMYKDTPVPNPALVALGVKFGTMEEFIKHEVVPRFA